MVFQLLYGTLQRESTLNSNTFLLMKTLLYLCVILVWHSRLSWSTSCMQVKFLQMLKILIMSLYLIWEHWARFFPKTVENNGIPLTTDDGGSKALFASFIWKHCMKSWLYWRPLESRTSLHKLFLELQKSRRSCVQPSLITAVIFKGAQGHAYQVESMLLTQWQFIDFLTVIQIYMQAYVLGNPFWNFKQFYSRKLKKKTQLQ